MNGTLGRSTLIVLCDVIQLLDSKLNRSLYRGQRVTVLLVVPVLRGHHLECIQVDHPLLIQLHFRLPEDCRKEERCRFINDLCFFARAGRYCVLRLSTLILPPTRSMPLLFVRDWYGT